MILKKITPQIILNVLSSAPNFKDNKGNFMKESVVNYLNSKAEKVENLNPLTKNER